MASGVNNSTAGLQQQIAATQQQIAALGGGGAAATTGAAGAATGTATAASTPKWDNDVPGVIGSYPTANGTMVTVVRDQAGQETITPTGRTEKVAIDGKTVRFGADGKTITAFQQIESLQFKVNLDNREGIASGLSNLSKMFGARQERVKLLSNALADDANDTGQFNPVDLQQMSIETTTTQQLSEMQKKIFDSMRDSIQAWLR